MNIQIVLCLLVITSSVCGMNQTVVIRDKETLPYSLGVDSWPIGFDRDSKTLISLEEPKYNAQDAILIQKPNKRVVIPLEKKSFNRYSYAYPFLAYYTSNSCDVHLLNCATEEQKKVPLPERYAIPHICFGPDHTLVIATEHKTAIGDTIHNVGFDSSSGGASLKLASPSQDIVVGPYFKIQKNKYERGIRLYIAPGHIFEYPLPRGNSLGALHVHNKKIYALVHESDPLTLVTLPILKKPTLAMCTLSTSIHRDDTSMFSYLPQDVKNKIMAQVYALYIQEQKDQKLTITKNTYLNEWFTIANNGFVQKIDGQHEENLITSCRGGIQFLNTEGIQISTFCPTDLNLSQQSQRTFFDLKSNTYVAYNIPHKGIEVSTIALEHTAQEPNRGCCTIL